MGVLVYIRSEDVGLVAMAVAAPRPVGTVDDAFAFASAASPREGVGGATLGETRVAALRPGRVEGLRVVHVSSVVWRSLGAMMALEQFRRASDADQCTGVSAFAALAAVPSRFRLVVRNGEAWARRCRALHSPRIWREECYP